MAANPANIRTSAFTSGSEILSNPDFGHTAEARLELLNRGGLTITTTIDPAMQAAADRAIKRYVHASDDPVAAEALVEPGTGAIKAMAASRPYGRSKAKNEISYNLVADAAHGGGVGFQAGSTFKTFTLITALKQGMKVDDGLTAGAGYRAPGYSTFKNCAGENIGDPTHTVTNDEGSPGCKTLRTGTWGSVNTFFMSWSSGSGSARRSRRPSRWASGARTGARCRSTRRSRSASTRWTR